MRTTVDIPDELYRQAKSQAALQGVRTPTMPALCDVNVLLALVTDRHAHHADAVRWLDNASAEDAVVCRIAQTGLLSKSLCNLVSIDTCKK